MSKLHQTNIVTNMTYACQKHFYDPEANGGSTVAFVALSMSATSGVFAVYTLGLGAIRAVRSDL
jgi:hypothetical protein